MGKGTITVGVMTLGMIGTNCYALYRENSNAEGDLPQVGNDGKTHCIVFDPADRGEYIYDILSKRNFVIDLILLTHAHFDHIGGAAELMKLSGAKLCAFEGERDLCENAELNCSINYGKGITVKVDEFLPDLQMIEAADMKCQLIATPGHTKGSCCYFFDEAHILISGDTLFAESVGRSDMPTGSMSSLIRSVKERLMALPDDTVVYPGHGESTTIGNEKKYNSFIQ